MCRKNRWWCVAVSLLTIACPLVVLADDVADTDPDETTTWTVEHDEQNHTTRLVIPTHEGQIAWSDVLRGLARTTRLDDSVLCDLLPSGSFDINAAGHQYTIMAVNLALAPQVSMAILPAADDRKEPALEIVVDHGRRNGFLRTTTKRIRQALVNGEYAEHFRLHLDENWAAADESLPLVVVVHGFNSSAEGITGLVGAVGEAKLPVGTFNYPNDQPIAESAAQLAAELRKLAAEHPNRQIALLTHSMGGLVAREAVENPELDPGNVTRLVMIAPPTHGSQVAQFSFGVDVWEHFVGWEKFTDLSRFYAAVEDGLAEAADDLVPGSEFLRTLNARKRNENVSYTIFLGTDGLLSAEQLQSLREAIDAAAERSDAVKFFRPRLQQSLTDIAEVVEGEGDGVVAVARGRLQGVEDTVLMEFTHLGPTDDRVTESDRDLYDEVRKRLLNDEQ